MCRSAGIEVNFKANRDEHGICDIVFRSIGCSVSWRNKVHLKVCTMERIKRARTAGQQEEIMHFTSAFDHDSLDCVICMEHLVLPIHQCINGHVACASCREKLNNTCPYCSEELGKIRNLALEKLIESLQVNCKFCDYGCGDVVKFTEKHSHETHCKYAPLKCPLSGCALLGPQIDFLHHFEAYHAMKRIDITYGAPYEVALEGATIHSNYVLHGKAGTLFLFNTKDSSLGRMFYIARFGGGRKFRHEGGAKDVYFSYELELIDNTDSSFPTTHRLESRCQPMDQNNNVEHFIVLAPGATKVQAKFVISRWSRKSQQPT